MTRPQENFVLQQGFKDATAQSCVSKYPALMWQPRLIGILVVIGVLLQDGRYFLVLSAILWWSALLPPLNPFDALFNRLVARPKNLSPLTPAPGPRRFAQGMAGTFMLAIGWSLLSGRHVLAWILEGALVVALVLLLFGRFCVGSYVFLLLTGQGKWANRTLPWSRTSQS